MTGRRRRRRGNSDAVTVAELTGEIPVVGREDHHDETTRPGPAAHSHRANGAPRLAEPVPDERPEPVPDPDHLRAGMARIPVALDRIDAGGSRLRSAAQSLPAVAAAGRGAGR